MTRIVAREAIRVPSYISPSSPQAIMLSAFVLVSACVVGVATATQASSITVAHESLITPAPVVYDVDELQRAWPTSDAVPTGGQCKY